MLAIPSDYSLAGDEVHVWQTGMNWSPESLRALREILSTEEIERSDRFHFDADRKRHIVGRSLLRLLLAHVLGASAADLRFDYNQFGKPALPGADLQFSVSHSGNLILVALTAGRAIGVDVECVHTDFDNCELQQLPSFTPDIRAQSELEQDQQRDRFFVYWARKEAFVKATGQGLSLRLDQFQVLPLPGRPARLLVTPTGSARSGPWVLQDLEFGEGYKAAVAVEGLDRLIKVRHLPESALAG